MTCAVGKSLPGPFAINSERYTVTNSGFAKVTRYRFEDHALKIVEKRQTDFREELLLKTEFVIPLDVKREKSESSQSANGVEAKRRIKKYIDETKERDSVSEHSSRINESYDLKKKRCVRSVQFLRSAFAQRKYEIIPMLLKVGARAFDELDKATWYGLLRMQTDNVKSIFCTLGRYGSEVIQPLIKACEYAFGIADDANKKPRNTVQANNFPEEFSENLNALRDQLLNNEIFFRNEENIATIRSLIKACAYEFEVLQDVVIKPVENTDKNNDNGLIKKYIKKLQLFQPSLAQEDVLVMQPLSEIYIDSRVYESNAKDNVASSSQDINSAIDDEQYKVDLDLLEFVRSGGHYEMFPDLVEISTGINKKTILHRAAERGNIKNVEISLEHGVERSLRDEKRRTPLHAAAAGGHIEVVKILLGENTCEEIDCQTVDGETPLFLAAKGGHEEVVQLLVGRGANLFLANASIQTAYRIAADTYNGNSGYAKFSYSGGRNFMYADSPYARIATFLRNKMNESRQKMMEVEPKIQDAQLYA